MLPPPKRWKRKYDASINAEDNADDDLDESEDDKPDWHASFNVESRTAGVLRIENVAWVREALHVSTKLRAREVKHVMWWDTQAANPKREALYALPHLNYTHNTGVVEFSVPPACCLRLALFLDEPSSYDVNGWLVMGGKPYPGYARYPYVHSRLGHVSSVQEVRTPPCARMLPHTTGNNLTCFSCLPAFCTEKDSASVWQDSLRLRLGESARGAAARRNSQEHSPPARLSA